MLPIIIVIVVHCEKVIIIIVITVIAIAIIIIIVTHCKDDASTKAKQLKELKDDVGQQKAGLACHTHQSSRS